MASSSSTPSVAVDMLNLDYRAVGVTDTLGIANTTAARKLFEFGGGTKIGNDGWSLSSSFHTGLSSPRIRAL